MTVATHTRDRNSHLEGIDWPAVSTDLIVGTAPRERAGSAGALSDTSVMRGPPGR